MGYTWHIGVPVLVFPFHFGRSRAAARGDEDDDEPKGRGRSENASHYLAGLHRDSTSMDRHWNTYAGRCPKWQPS